MAQVKPEVRRILETFGLNPRDALWDCHGSWVLLHRACQTIAMKMGIKFDEPKVLHMDISKKEVVFMIKGTNKDGESRYDIGEAMPSNNKNSYPVSMALKRAEDKVIIHLARLREHGVYSSEEADEFKSKPANKKGVDHMNRVMTLIKEATTADNVREIIKGHRDELNGLPVASQRRIQKAREDKLSSFKE